jgi:hypothetical protein
MLACILLVNGLVISLLCGVLVFQYLPFNGSKEVVTMFAMNANYGSIILSVT